MVPMHPQDQCLLGVQWKGNTYVDLALSSIPTIFSAVADVIQWILVQKGVKFLYYLDDLIFIPGSYEEADSQKQLFIGTFKILGVPLETSILEGPMTCLIFWALNLIQFPFKFLYHHRSF